MKHQTNIRDDHNLISPTAKLVAYLRSFSDVPYASEVSLLTDAERITREIAESTGANIDAVVQMAPFVEARAKSITNYLRRTGRRQVLELASGILMRGLHMTADSGLKYVHSDLPEILEEEKSLEKTLCQILGIPFRQNLYYEPVNAICPEQITAAARHFDEGPIAVVHEGMMNYFSKDEKIKLALNIKELLKQFRGVWITPDFSTKERYNRYLTNPDMAKIMEAVSGATARDLYNCAFDNEEEIRQFIRTQGFKAEVLKQFDGRYKLTSLENSQIPEKRIDEMFKDARLWVLTPG